MKKKLAKLLVLSLILSVCFGLAPAAQAAVSKTMRIGLLYGSDAIPAAKLTNTEGTGFRFGYYDSALNFVSLGWTGEQAVDVLITQNLYLNSKGGYGYSSDNARGTVGCYHIHLPWSYEDFASAYEAAQLVEGGFVAWVEGAYHVRVGAYPSKEEAQAALDALGSDAAVLKGTSGYGYSVVAHGTTRVLFQYDANTAGEAGAFGVQPGLEAGEATVTALNDGNKYRGGFRFERVNGGASTVVNIVDLEDYVKGIVPYEMSASWPLEALKAQAVCARTYSIYNTQGRAKHGADHFDLCTTTHCQVYRGVGSANANSDQAVAETAGQLAYYNGKLIDAVYYSSNGGASEDAKNVWVNDLGYLKGKLDPYEADIADRAGNYHWVKTLTAEELKTRVHNKGRSTCGDIVSVTTRQSAVGNTIELTVTDVSGKSFTFSGGDTVRSLLGTNSIRFTMTTSGGSAASSAAPSASGYQIAGAAAPAASLDGLYALGGDGTAAPLPQESYIVTADGVKALEPVQAATAPTSGAASYTFTGTGWGHNVGLSQWGAYAMAQRGYTYLDILKFYYTDITVE